MMRVFFLASLLAMGAVACGSDDAVDEEEPTYESRFDLACSESSGSLGADESEGFDVATDVFAQCSAPLPEPCQTLNVRDGVGAPSEPLDRLAFDCIADAFIAGKPALVRLSSGNGINFETSYSVAVIGDGTAVVRTSSLQDLGGTSTSFGPRALMREAAHFEGCKAIDDDMSAAACLFDFADGCAASGDVCSEL